MNSFGKIIKYNSFSFCIPKPLKNFSILFSKLYLLFLLVQTNYSFALPRLSEREFLARCYNQITGNHLGSSSSLWARLNSQSSSAICLSILNNVNLDANGNLTSPNDPLNRHVLKQFIDMHRTWFENQWAFLSTFPDSYWGGVDIYDPQEPSLFLTRNLLLGEPYSKVLRGSDTAVALRDGSKILPTLPPEADGLLRISRLIPDLGEGPIINSSVITYTSTPPYSQNQLKTIPVPLVQVGEPYGIQLASYFSSPLLPTIWTDAFSPTATFITQGVTLPQAFMANKGGGALGSVPYLILNFGHGFDYKANGAEKLPRRYILSVFKNFLCRQGPFLRTSDVKPWISDLEKAPAFRKSEACLRCHVALDQSALILRNFRLGATTPMSYQDFRSPPVLANYDVDANVTANEFWPAVGQSDFYRTKPEGLLYFRSITGQLINISISNLESLGKSITETPDYYACAAKRYFEFFTHNKVELFDPYDPSNESLIANMTEKDHQMKAFVLALGKELQQSGTLKTMIRRILESEFYGQGNFGR